MQFPKFDNHMRRSRLLKRIRVTHTKQRSRLSFSKALGPAVRLLQSIVSPRTFSRQLTDVGWKMLPAARRPPQEQISRTSYQDLYNGYTAFPAWCNTVRRLPTFVNIVVGVSSPLRFASRRLFTGSAIL